MKQQKGYFILTPSRQGGTALFNTLQYTIPRVYRPGYFITFEGIEGCGKSTQVKLLAEYLRKKGFKIYLTSEPGGTAISKKIRKILLDPANKNMFCETELLLYLASRAQLIREKILFLLKKKFIVLCDRYSDSTVAYQGYARGISIEQIEKMNKIATGGLVPDLTILLDTDVSTGLKRAARKNKSDRLEQENKKFHNKVRRGFLTIARRFPKRVKVIKINSIEGTQVKIRKYVDRFLIA